MNTTLTCAAVFGSLVLAVLMGRSARRLLPEAHLAADTKDTVKLAMGLVATMTALLLGLLVSSAKGSYDSARSQVIQIAAKVSFLDRVLRAYGPEAGPLRGQFHAAMQNAVKQMWPEEHNRPAQFAPDVEAGDAMYAAIQNLKPQDDLQRSLKDQAAKLALELGQLRTLLLAQTHPSIARPLLFVVVAWLVIIYSGFSVIAPPNLTSTFALIASAASVAGAIFLILGLDRPFSGVLCLSSEPLVNALQQFPL